ncbi:DUF3566 domain-containing protein [Streptomyces sp. NBC_01408]|uniref:DUF3566 domain-containing protein n=1 Tax=Streptomyces sp. NBC_01408 TaxID=2903855 RepID=UPI00225319B9|nr:DUF3566 domain-containing protein [Streptomyces sp. NBC_01408]MCX4692212.1 DUF3566 domain-containing protein [Streptomyces sp. NBC_01408]
MSGATGAGPAGTGANGARGPATDSQGGTVTDTREPQRQAGAETDQDRPAQPYQPPQAYAAPSGPGAPRGGSPASAQRKPRTGARTAPRTRKARLRVAKADPWSVMKVSFLLSIALGICTVVAAAVLWMVMDAMSVFSTVGGTISEATGSNESNGFDLQSFLSLPRVLIFTSVIAVIDVVLATALATLGAFIYNLSAGFVGGVELTLAEDE